MDHKEQIGRYIDYIKEHGVPYLHSDMLKIITDYDVLVDYAERNNKDIGFIYQSGYNTFVVDLVENASGELFTYERIIKTNMGNSVVIVPVKDDKYVLLKQFRHALGDYQIAFPRGYGEDGLSIEENARKELSEELNTTASFVNHIGTVVADSGICGERVNVVLCRIDEIVVDGVYEEIKEYMLLTEEEIDGFIASGVIQDGFTISAWSIYKSQNRQ